MALFHLVRVWTIARRPRAWASRARRATNASRSGRVAGTTSHRDPTVVVCGGVQDSGAGGAHAHASAAAPVNAHQRSLPITAAALIGIAREHSIAPVSGRTSGVVGTASYYPASHSIAHC